MVSQLFVNPHTIVSCVYVITNSSAAADELTCYRVNGRDNNYNAQRYFETILSYCIFAIPRHYPLMGVVAELAGMLVETLQCPGTTAYGKTSWFLLKHYFRARVYCACVWTRRTPCTTITAMFLEGKLLYYFIILSANVFLCYWIKSGADLRIIVSCHLQVQHFRRFRVNRKKMYGEGVVDYEVSHWKLVVSNKRILMIHQ